MGARPVVPTIPLRAESALSVAVHDEISAVVSIVVQKIIFLQIGDCKMRRVDSAKEQGRSRAAAAEAVHVFPDLTSCIYIQKGEHLGQPKSSPISVCAEMTRSLEGQKSGKFHNKHEAGKSRLIENGMERNAVNSTSS
jgi:hypothetical protein